MRHYAEQRKETYEPSTQRKPTQRKPTAAPLHGFSNSGVLQMMGVKDTPTDDGLYKALRRRFESHFLSRSTQTPAAENETVEFAPQTIDDVATADINEEPRTRMFPRPPMPKTGVASLPQRIPSQPKPPQPKPDFSVETVQQEETPNLTGIPDSIKDRVEVKSGRSFDDVRVHYNSDKPEQLQALAYTQGNNVHIAPGQERHLEHELGHVAQQKQGRVMPTTEVGGVAVNDDAGLEREADGALYSRQEQFPQVESAGSYRDVYQLKVDANRLNVVGEDHFFYIEKPQRRENEKNDIEKIFGKGCYILEDSSDFSASKDTRVEDEKQDYHNSFLSKGDAPYYSICQGLKYVISDIDQHSTPLGNAVHFLCSSIKTQLGNGVLKKVQHDKYFKKYDSFNEKINNEATKATVNMDELAKLKAEIITHLNEIEKAYDAERFEFDNTVGISNANIPKDENEINRKRSYAMAWHIKGMFEQGKKGVIKVGFEHCNDFKEMEDFPYEIISTYNELQQFVNDYYQNNVQIDYDQTPSIYNSDTTVDLSDEAFQ